MDNEAPKCVISKEWKKLDPIKKLDIVMLDPTGQEFLCFNTVKKDDYELLYLGGFDYKTALLAIQAVVNNTNYARILHKENEQKMAYKTLKEIANAWILNK